MEMCRFLKCQDFPHSLPIMVKVKVKLPLCLIKYFIMKTYGGVEVEHAFLTSALDGGERPAERVDHFTSGEKTQYSLDLDTTGELLKICMVIVKDGMGGACNMHGEVSNAYKILVRKPDGKRSLGRPRCK
jgi:hypothetical protein